MTKKRFKISFFGDGVITDITAVYRKVLNAARLFLMRFENIEFVLGEGGMFDRVALAALCDLKRESENPLFFVTLTVSPHSGEYIKKYKYPERYFDRTEILSDLLPLCEIEALSARNKKVAEESDLIVYYHKNPGDLPAEVLSLAEACGVCCVDIAEY